MCTQLTYAGLIDDIYKIHSGSNCMGFMKLQGSVRLEGDLIPQWLRKTEEKKVKIPLNSSDPIFKEIRYKFASSSIF